ncbi:MAG: preQ(1) synthase [Planctomycetota bacterium]
MSIRPPLDVFQNPCPHRDYLITHVAREFTSLCPMTGQPDFGRLTLQYVPNEKCVELKSLKLYFQSFRSDGIFYEDVTNTILNDLVSACSPKWMGLRSKWTVRGGIHSLIDCQFGDRRVVEILRY